MRIQSQGLLLTRDTQSKTDPKRIDRKPQEEIQGAFLLAEIKHMTKLNKKKSKAVESPTVWSIEVLTDSYCDVTREADENDSWSRESTSTHWTVEGLKLAQNDNYGTVAVAFKPVKGEIYHLLYAVYSTGDSFGHDEGRNFEAIGVYKDRKVAEENEKRLTSAPKKGANWDDQFKAIVLKTEGLGEHKYSRPWVGYFESLDRLEVESFVLS